MKPGLYVLLAAIISFISIALWSTHFVPYHLSCVQYPLCHTYQMYGIQAAAGYAVSAVACLPNVRYAGSCRVCSIRSGMLTKCTICRELQGMQYPLWHAYQMCDIQATAGYAVSAVAYLPNVRYAGSCRVCSIRCGMLTKCTICRQLQGMQYPQWHAYQMCDIQAAAGCAVSAVACLPNVRYTGNCRVCSIRCGLLTKCTICRQLQGMQYPQWHAYQMCDIQAAAGYAVSAVCNTICTLCCVLYYSLHGHNGRIIIWAEDLILFVA
jgi:hypothetical protein